MTAPETRSAWQIEQAKKCGCRGSDEYCPCQNTNSTTPARAEAPPDDLRTACKAVLDDYQTSDAHHPDHVLIRRTDFERIKALVEAPVAARAEALDKGAAGEPVAKPLDWRKPTKRELEEGGRDCALWIAPGFAGEYAIQADGAGFILWRIDDPYAFDSFPTVDAAKAYAEADWQKTIGRKIAVRPSPPAAQDDRLRKAVEVVGWRWPNAFAPTGWCLSGVEPKALRIDSSLEPLVTAASAEARIAELEAALAAAQNADAATIKALIAELREARGLLSESADLTGLCTTPDRFSECGTGEVFLRMTAHNAEARAFLARNGKGEGG